MSETPPTDWKLAESMFHQGFSYVEIGKKINKNLPAIRQHMRRAGLVQARRKAQEFALEKAAPEATQNEVLAKTDQKVRTNLANEIATASEALQALPQPTSLKGFKQRQEIVNTMSDSAREIFGWSAESIRACKIDIHVLAHGEEDLVRDESITIEEVKPNDAA